MKISKGFYVCKDGIFSPVFFNKDGNPYVKFNIEAKRIADEFIIICMPMDKFKDWCLKNGFVFLYRY